MNDQPLQDAKLRDLAQQLGARAADRLDPEATADAVLRRLREPSSRHRAAWQPLWLSAAATLVLLLGGGVVWRSMQPARPAPASALEQADLDLNDLSPDQLREILSAVDQPLDVEPAGSGETDFDDLTPREMRTLLRALEG